MTRSSKFPFQRAGRRNQEPEEAQIEHISPPSLTLFPPKAPDRPPSKAERFLGASNLGAPPNFPRPKSQQQQQQQQPRSPRPSPGEGMHISRADVGYTGDGYDLVDYPSRYVDVGHHDLRNRPSSNALGEPIRHHHLPSVTASSATGQKMRHQPSDSTLRSFYDPARTPLTVSQQTSSSAIRDRGLRRDHAAASTHSRRLSRSGSISSDRNHDGEPSGSSKWGARLDLTKLFPKPRSTDKRLLSPNKLVHSPSQMSLSSDYFTPPPHEYRQNESRGGNSNSRSDEPSRAEKPPLENKYDNAKMNVRRPPKGIQNWFDGLLEDDSEEEEEEEPEMVPPTPHSLQSSEYQSYASSQRSQDMHDRRYGPSYDDERRRYRGVRPPAGHDKRSHGTLRPRHDQDSVSVHSGFTTMTRESRLSRSNLNEASVLSFSSSEDEDHLEESDLEGSRACDSVHTADTRDSVGQMLIGRARPVELKPRSKSGGEHLPAQASEGASRSRDRGPPPRSRSTRETSSNDDVDEGYASPRRHKTRLSRIVEDGPRPASREADRPSSRSASHEQKEKDSEIRALKAEQHKLMAVTEEEEALLEMMRSKRAAMAKHSFTEGYRTAIKQEQRRIATQSAQSSVQGSPTREPRDARPPYPRSMPSTDRLGSSAGGGGAVFIGKPPIPARTSSITFRQPTNILSAFPPTPTSPDLARGGDAFPLPPTSPPTTLHLSPPFPTPPSVRPTPSLETLPASTYRTPTPTHLTALQHPPPRPLSPFSVPLSPTPPATASLTASPLPSPLTPRRGSAASSHDPVRVAPSSGSSDAADHDRARHRESTASDHMGTITVAVEGPGMLGKPLLVLPPASSAEEPPHPPASTPLRAPSVRVVGGVRSAVVSEAVVKAKLAKRMSAASSSSGGSTGRVGARAAWRHPEAEAVRGGDVRSSVSEDVLAAWGSLGGWRDWESVEDGVLV